MNSKNPILAAGAGASVGILGGLIGLGGAEFRLPLLISMFGYKALPAVVLIFGHDPAATSSPILIKGSHSGDQEFKTPKSGSPSSTNPSAALGSTANEERSTSWPERSKSSSTSCQHKPSCSRLIPALPRRLLLDVPRPPEPVSHTCG